MVCPSPFFLSSPSNSILTYMLTHTPHTPHTPHHTPHSTHSTHTHTRADLSTSPLLSPHCCASQGQNSGEALQWYQQTLLHTSSRQSSQVWPGWTLACSSNFRRNSSFSTMTCSWKVVPQFVPLNDLCADIRVLWSGALLPLCSMEGYMGKVKIVSPDRVCQKISSEV